jgi:hypothetical protein
MLLVWAQLSTRVRSRHCAGEVTPFSMTARCTDGQGERSAHTCGILEGHHVSSFSTLASSCESLTRIAHPFKWIAERRTSGKSDINRLGHRELGQNEISHSANLLAEHSRIGQPEPFVAPVLVSESGEAVRGFHSAFPRPLVLPSFVAADLLTNKAGVAGFWSLRKVAESKANLSQQFVAHAKQLALFGGSHPGAERVRNQAPFRVSQFDGWHNRSIA